MASIKFDNVEICNSTYIPRYIKHETTAIREVEILELAGEDGAVLVSEKYGIKHITVIGRLTADSRSALDTAIDSFKELFSRKEKNLDISWESGTRRYAATCIKHSFNRDFYHNLFVPWSAEFVVVKGVGTSIVSKDMYNGTLTTDTATGTATASKGSAEPKPYKIQMTFSSTTGKGKKGIAFECGGKQLIYTTPNEIEDNNAILINCRDKTVEFYDSDWKEVAFHGEFPEFALGDNDFSVQFGEIKLEDTLDYGGGHIYIYDTHMSAQSFSIPWKDESIDCISISGGEVGTPAGNLYIRIETDDGGKPSGTLADTNAEITVAPGGTSGYPYKYYFPATITLEANTTYWIVLKSPSSTSSSNCYYWVRTDVNVYLKGNASESSDSGSTWTDYPEKDHCFTVYVGGKRTSNSSISTVISHYPRYL